MKLRKATLGLVGATLLALSVMAPGAAFADEATPPAQEGEEYRATSASDAEFGFLPGESSDSAFSAQAQGSIPFTGRVQAHTPHKSGGDASGHVSWYLTSGTNQKVTLTSTLKARTSWVTFRTMVGPISKSVYAGGGSGKDAVARFGCGSSNDRDWYTYGEAFAPGAPHPFGSHSSSIASVKCQGGLD